MTYLQAKAKLANIAGGNKFSISYQETENWSPDYPETLVGITLHCGNECVCSKSYEHAFALLAAKMTAQDAPTSAQHPDMDDAPQAFNPCPDCGGRETKWYNESAGVAVCDDCGQFITLSTPVTVAAPLNMVSLANEILGAACTANSKEAA